MGQERKPDLEGLREFIAEKDRDEARFFVGREALIGEIRQAAASVRRGRFASATFVIQGAPGAGKTALLSRLGKLWTGPDDPLVLNCDIEVVKNPATLVDAISQVTAPGLLAWLRGRFSFGLRGRVGLPGVAGIEGEVRPPAPLPGAAWMRLRRRWPPEKWTRPLCLLVDEIQVLEKEDAATFRSLHQGTPGLPIIPVLAGLAQSQAVLARCGISRLSDGAVKTLGALDAGEPAEAVRQMLDRFAINAIAADADRWARLIEARSGRWPQHLQNGMRSLAEGLIEADGALAQVDEGAAMVREEQCRTRAYRARRSDEMRYARCLVAGVMAEIGDRGRRLDEVTDLVRKLARTDGPEAWRLPRRMEAEDFVDHLIARGALQFNDDDCLACPIPSFRRFLVDQGRQDSHQASSPQESPQPQRTDRGVAHFPEGSREAFSAPGAESDT